MVLSVNSDYSNGPAGASVAPVYKNTNAASFSAFFELWIKLEGGTEAASDCLANSCELSLTSYFASAVAALPRW